MEKIITILLQSGLYFQQAQKSAHPFSLETLYVCENLENALKFACYEKADEPFFKKCGGTCYREEAERMNCHDCAFSGTGRPSSDFVPPTELLAGLDDCRVIDYLKDALKLMVKEDERSYLLAVDYLRRAIAGAEKLARLKTLNCERSNHLKRGIVGQ